VDPSAPSNPSALKPFGPFGPFGPFKPFSSEGLQPAVLGLDLGTSRLKALLCAPDGAVLGRGTAGYQVSVPRDGWAETDPELWWHAALTAVRSAVEAANAQVMGLADSAWCHPYRRHGHGHVAGGDHHRPFGPYLGSSRGTGLLPAG
jgi:xylulokinase